MFKVIAHIVKPNGNVMTNWLIRAAISIPLLCGLALILKHYLIKPYSVVTVEFELIDDGIFRSQKGDREI